MDQFFKAVSDAGLSTEIIQKLKEMIEEPDDFQLFSAGDIAREFPDIGWKEKKTLKKFISQQKTLSAHQETPHQSRGEPVSQTGDGSVLLGTGSIGSNAQVAGTINNTPGESSSVRVSVGQATGSNIAGGSIRSTTYNSGEVGAYGGQKRKRQK